MYLSCSILRSYLCSSKCIISNNIESTILSNKIKISKNVTFEAFLLIAVYRSSFSATLSYNNLMEMSSTNEISCPSRYLLRRYGIEYRAKRITFERIISKEVSYCNYQSGFMERIERYRRFDFFYLTMYDHIPEVLQNIK